MEEPTYEEIELIGQGFCEACKGMIYMQDTGCYEDCEGFADELKDTRESMTVCPKCFNKGDKPMVLKCDLKKPGMVTCDNCGEYSWPEYIKGQKETE